MQASNDPGDDAPRPDDGGLILPFLDLSGRPTTQLDFNHLICDTLRDMARDSSVAAAKIEVIAGAVAQLIDANASIAERWKEQADVNRLLVARVDSHEKCIELLAGYCKSLNDALSRAEAKLAGGGDRR